MAGGASAIAIAGHWVCARDGALRCWVETPAWQTPAVTLDDATDFAMGEPPLEAPVPATSTERDEPVADVFVRRRDGPVDALHLTLTAGLPAATWTRELASHVRRLYVIGDRPCTDGDGGIRCSVFGVDPEALPPAFAGARAVAITGVACAVLADGHVLCADADAWQLGTGHAVSRVPSRVVL